MTIRVERASTPAVAGIETTTSNNDIRMRAQSLTDHVGKTLRLTDDGGVPPDNPFVGQPGARPEIFTIGNRSG